MKLAAKLRGIVIAVAVCAIVVVAVRYLRTTNIQVLNPKGIIARQELHLMILVGLLMLVIVIPVFIMLFAIAWRYRESNTKAKYTPDWDHSRVAETIWWLIPSALILVLSVITWRYTYKLDPYQPIASTTPPITIQAVALDWKWLFIYPDQHIASVGLVQLPVNTPVKFEITSDAPMNSFWIPQLGGQIYAMAGMSSQLNLMADQTGDFRGSSANISGAGFAGMTFIARSSSQLAFNQWVASAQKSPNQLSAATYDELLKPSTRNAVTYYSQAEPNLYNQTIMKYMMPSSQSGSPDMAGMDMSDMSAQ